MTAGLRPDPVVVESAFVAVERHVAFRALARQPELFAPAKLALSVEGKAGFYAEVPRLAERQLCERLALAALEATRAWLDGSGTEASREAALDSGRLEQALCQSPWDWQRLEGGGYRLQVVQPGVVGRMRVEAAGPDRLRVLGESSLALRSPSVREAAAHFALEANRRLRLARLSVVPAPGELTSVVWDVVLPDALPLAPALDEAVDALAAAQAATWRSLRALCHEPVAQAFLSFAHDGRDHRGG